MSRSSSRKPRWPLAADAGAAGRRWPRRPSGSSPRPICARGSGWPRRGAIAARCRCAHQQTQRLASGNESVRGQRADRSTRPTTRQAVPPLRAELLDATKSEWSTAGRSRRRRRSLDAEQERQLQQRRSRRARGRRASCACASADRPSRDLLKFDEVRGAAAAVLGADGRLGHSTVSGIGGLP